MFEELSKGNTLIFTTHSPYLIDPDKLNNVRLIIKNRSNTEIINNFNNGFKADEDTLTPIITAIGLDLSRGIGFTKQKNVIVEGVSDYYYLQGILLGLEKSKKYKFPKDVGFIPCIGHTKSLTIASILTGWELNDFIVLLDKKGTKDTKKKLEKDGIPENRILFAGKEKNDLIEEMFSQGDLDKYNLKSDDQSKSIIAKLFFNKMVSEEIQLSEETYNNFIGLLDNIQKAMNDEINIIKT